MWIVVISRCCCSSHPAGRCGLQWSGLVPGLYPQRLGHPRLQLQREHCTRLQPWVFRSAVSSASITYFYLFTGQHCIIIIPASKLDPCTILTVGEWKMTKVSLCSPVYYSSMWWSKSTFVCSCAVVPDVTGLRVTGVSPNSITLAWNVKHVVYVVHILLIFTITMYYGAQQSVHMLY